jgi:selenocysteine lyase/cysteine desulfurase
MSQVVEAPKATSHSSLEQYFERFRQNTIGQKLRIDTPIGQLPMLYADWIASGRLYQPIEDKISSVIGPYMANTHTESNTSGRVMTEAYHQARELIKRHVGADEKDVLISSGSGMTSVINKMQRILGLRTHERYRTAVRPSSKAETPIVFLTHMEHHSNQTSWLECLVDVEVIPADKQGLPDLEAYERLLKEHSDRPLIIAAVTSCSNVTGVLTPYREIARLTHRHKGICVVDFAASAPYIDIEMRPKDDPEGHLDAICFSPHKFLGGPGGTGILIFCPKLYTNKIPDNPGGGTVDWTNPWGEHKYLDSIEAREDGGTPAILQTIKSALAIRLKEEMGTKQMHKREVELIDRIWEHFEEIPNLRLLEPHLKNRIGAVSFYIEDLHFNLGVRLLNDRFGIQVRGGCHCAGTYGHYLLNVDRNTSKAITDDITAGKLSSKPGWIRLSIHPMMTNASVDFILSAIEEVALYHKRWAKDYRYDISINDFIHVNEEPIELVDEWFK